MKVTQLWAAPLLLFAAAVPASAQQCACQGRYPSAGMHPAKDSCEAAFWENHMWPQQYAGPARRGICQSIEVMTANGWRRNNLLGKYHFQPNGEQLNEAGRLKTEWILTQAPPARRTVYVQRDLNAELTAGRIESVQQFAANMTPAGEPDVQETHIRDDGYPAGAVDAVFTGFQANRPIPALPTAASASSGGGEE